MEAFGKLSAAIIMIVISVAIRAFVLVKLWAWFITGTFDLQRITMLEAMGLSLFLGYLIKAEQPKNDDEKGFLYIVQHFIFQIMLALIVLTMGYLIIQLKG